MRAVVRLCPRASIHDQVVRREALYANFYTACCDELVYVCHAALNNCSRALSSVLSQPSDKAACSVVLSEMAMFTCRYSDELKRKLQGC